MTDDSNAAGPPSTNTHSESDEYCSLPSEAPCIGFNVGVLEASGPSVGMYYDKACLDGGGGLSGCNGGGVQACRVCFVNRVLWAKDFSDEREPDW